MQTETERLYKLDNLKLLLIFLVVLGHAADLYANVSHATGIMRFVIYSFHMPLFLFVSGLVSKRNIAQRRYSHIAAYLGLYIFIKVVNFAANWATTGVLPQVTVFADSGEPWYAFCLFAFGFLTIVLEKLKPVYVLVFSVLLACLAGYDTSIGDAFCLSRIIVFYPFYYLGYWLDAQKVCAFFSKKWLIPAALTILAAAVVATVFLYDDITALKFLFTGRNSYQKAMLTPHTWGFAWRLLCYAVSILVGSAFFVLVPKCRLGFLTRVGARSVQIYALQRVFIILYYRLLNQLFRLEGYFTSKLILYELLMALGVTVICALPIWNPLFNAIMRPFKKSELP